MHIPLDISIKLIYNIHCDRIFIQKKRCEMVKVFVVGSAGSTGLRLAERLSRRPDVKLLQYDESIQRKEPEEVRQLMQLSDFTFLCLPDDAAREIVNLAEGTGTRILDASTAHRTEDSFSYGFPELTKKHRQDIETANFVSVPGCHASGFIALVYPLIAAGIVSNSAPFSCSSITGYSGGGNMMIAEYENPGRNAEMDSPMLYAMGQGHKHMPEIVKHCGLEYPPVFMPIVANFHSGILVSVALHAQILAGRASLTDIREVLKEHYNGCKFVKVSNADESPASLYAGALSGRDDMEIYVSGTDECILLSARFDNLGKGSSGAAVQCFNIMCGIPEDTGLFVM